MHVVTTPQVVKKKFTEGNAWKFNVSFAFCVHVDVMKMEKAWCFPLSARELLELLSLARVRWWNYRQPPATLIWYHHHHYHHIYLVRCAYSCDIKLNTRREIKSDFSKRNSKSTRTHRVSIFSVSPSPFHLLTVGTTPPSAAICRLIGIISALLPAHDISWCYLQRLPVIHSVPL